MLSILFVFLFRFSQNWIEEYLIRIESSSKSFQQSISNNSDLLFEEIPLSNENPVSNWLSGYISIDESANQMMFSEQYLPGHEKLTPPIYMPLSSKQSQGSLMNLLSISADDEHSISSSSNSSRQQRLPSSFEVKMQFVWQKIWTELYFVFLGRLNYPRQWFDVWRNVNRSKIRKSTDPN